MSGQKNGFFAILTHFMLGKFSYIILCILFFQIGVNAVAHTLLPFSPSLPPPGLRRKVILILLRNSIVRERAEGERKRRRATPRKLGCGVSGGWVIFRSSDTRYKFHCYWCCWFCCSHRCFSSCHCRYHVCRHGNAHKRAHLKYTIKEHALLHPREFAKKNPAILKSALLLPSPPLITPWRLMCHRLPTNNGPVESGSNPGRIPETLPTPPFLPIFEVPSPGVKG